MSHTGDYSDKRQLKAITSHGKHHSSTITGNALGIFPEPFDLGAKEGKKHTEKKKPKAPIILENMIISIDLNVKDLAHSDGFIRMLSESLGVVRVKKDFEVLSTTEKIIRALAKAKFKNVATIELDDEVLYNHPEKFYDADEAIKEMMMDIKNKKKRGNNINMRMLSKDFKDCEVEIKVSRVHLPWFHDILIKFQGELEEEYFRRVINYLEENLQIENMEKDWKNA